MVRSFTIIRKGWFRRPPDKSQSDVRVIADRNGIALVHGKVMYSFLGRPAVLITLE
jgi:hypothetical protein